MTLFELATGVLPSAGDDGAALRFHLEGKLPDPLTFRPDMPPRLWRASSPVCFSAIPGSVTPRRGACLRIWRQAAGRSRRSPRRSPSRRAGCSPAGWWDARTPSAAARRARGGAAGAGRRGVHRRSRGDGQEPAAAGVPAVRRGRGGPRGGWGTARTSPRSPSAPFLAALGRLGIASPARPEQVPGEPDPREPDPRRVPPLPGERSEDRRSGGTGPPVVLLLDDAHLAGRRERGAAYLSGRGAARLPGAGGRGPASGRQRLRTTPSRPPRRASRPLDRAGTAQLVDACLGTPGFPASFYAWIHEQRRGLPGEVQRLLRHLVDDPCSSTATASGSLRSPPSRAGRARREEPRPRTGSGSPPSRSLSARCWRRRR